MDKEMSNYNEKKSYKFSVESLFTYFSLWFHLIDFQNTTWERYYSVYSSFSILFEDAKNIYKFS